MARLTNLSRAINTLVLLGSMGIATSIGIVYADSSENLTDDDKTTIMRGEPTNIPFGVGGLGVAPLVMITMGREHNLFTEAYSDYTDLDGDGKLEILKHIQITLTLMVMVNWKLCLTRHLITTGCLITNTVTSMLMELLI